MSIQFLQTSFHMKLQQRPKKDIPEPLNVAFLCNGPSTLRLFSLLNTVLSVKTARSVPVRPADVYFHYLKGKVLAGYNSFLLNNTSGTYKKEF